MLLGISSFQAEMARVIRLATEKYSNVVFLLFLLNTATCLILRIETLPSREVFEDSASADSLERTKR